MLTHICADGTADSSRNDALTFCFGQVEGHIAAQCLQGWMDITQLVNGRYYLLGTDQVPSPQQGRSLHRFIKRRTL